MRAGVLRSRQWHEQQTAAQRCHRCRSKLPLPSWYCSRCAREISEQKQGVVFFQLAAQKRCVECRKPHDGKGLAHPHCRRKQVLNTSGYFRRSSDWLHAPRRTMDSVRALPLPIDLDD